MGVAQTVTLRGYGVEDRHKAKNCQSNCLGKQGEESETLVDEDDLSGSRSRVPQDTRNPAGNRVDHHPRLNTTKRPIEESTVRER